MIERTIESRRGERYEVTRAGAAALAEEQNAAAMMMAAAQDQGVSPKVPSVTAEAGALVGGARQASYGHPYDNHTRIAAGWSQILGVEVTAEQAALCMLWTKIAREIHRPQRDNRVDIAGYAEVLDMIVARRRDLAGMDKE